MMARYGLIHYNVEGTLLEFLDFAAEAGFDCCELRVPEAFDPDDPGAEEQAEALRERMAARGLAISAISARNDFNVLDEDQVAAQVGRMERICRLAKLAGTDTIRTEGGRPKDECPEDRWVEAIAGCLKRCVDFVERENMYLALDNHGLITNADGIQLAIFEQVGSRHVGANVDFMNYRWFGHDLDTVLRLVRDVAPYALHTHCKDGCGVREDYRGAALGEGELPLAEYVATLKAAGYKGVWCAEYEGNEREDNQGYRKCLEWMKGNIRES